MNCIWLSWLFSLLYTETVPQPVFVLHGRDSFGRVQASYFVECPSLWICLNPPLCLPCHQHIKYTQEIFVEWTGGKMEGAGREKVSRFSSFPQLPLLFLLKDLLFSGNHTVFRFESCCFYNTTFLEKGLPQGDISRHRVMARQGCWRGEWNIRWGARLGLEVPPNDKRLSLTGTLTLQA